MHRLLVATELLKEDWPSLSNAAANHLKVLRPKSGEAVELFDGKGAYRTYLFSSDRDGLVSNADAPIRYAALPIRMTLFACVTKGSRWDWTIEKATELGVSKIVPVISDRTIVRIAEAERATKRERWQRIAEDAARQSDAKYVPEILAARDFNEALALVKATTCFIGALTNPPSLALVEALNQYHPTVSEPLATFIGPEGDFTPEELSALMQIAIPVSFGSAILRAETAAIYALSVLRAYGKV